MALYNGLYQQLQTATAVTSLLGAQAKQAIFDGAAAKQPPNRFVVINALNAPPAAQTLDGVSDLIDGEIQFDAYAENQQTAQKLGRAVRDFFKGWGGPLPDGTTIQFTEITIDRNAGFEQGAAGYTYRRLLRMKAMYTEAP